MSFEKGDSRGQSVVTAVPLGFCRYAWIICALSKRIFHHLIADFNGGLSPKSFILAEAILCPTIIGDSVTHALPVKAFDAF